MHFNNPIAREKLPKFVESSVQRSPRDSEATGKLWQKTAKTNAQADVDTHALHQLQRTVEKLRRRIVGGSAIIESTDSIIRQCKLKALYGSSSNNANYFTVRVWDGSDEIGDNFECAKSAPSRMVASYLGQYIYTYTDDNTRVSNRVSDSNTENQVMTQPFTVDDTVYVMKVDHTNINVANVEVKYIEVNTEREWTKPPDP